MSVVIAILLFTAIVLDVIILGVLHEQGKAFTGRAMNLTIDARGAVDASLIAERVRDAMKRALERRPHFDA